MQIIYGWSEWFNYNNIDLLICVIAYIWFVSDACYLVSKWALVKPKKPTAVRLTDIE